MSFWNTAWCMFVKDLKVELRTKEIVSSAGLFAVLVVIMFAFAFDLNNISANVTSAGSLWLATCFAGILAIGRTYLRERDFGVWTGLILSPASRAGFYMGKMLGLCAYLLVIDLVLIFVIELFFHAPIISNLHLIFPVLVLGIVGFCSMGALFGAMTIRTSVRDLLLGVILFPLISPVLILAVKATVAILGGEPLSNIIEYLKFLLGLDILFVALGLWLFDPLMED